MEHKNFGPRNPLGHIGGQDTCTSIGGTTRFSKNLVLIIFQKKSNFDWNIDIWHHHQGKIFGVAFESSISEPIYVEGMITGVQSNWRTNTRTGAQTGSSYRALLNQISRKGRTSMKTQLMPTNLSLMSPAIITILASSPLSLPQFVILIWLTPTMANGLWVC